ncbi:MBL fold metallo-hydrolase [Actibacterium sp. 188UL27-1]|uniref:MBL fold metallo-hydrolase n=1 Tax=Actibacterium sp. 188UL27-1 TaxID=2786961 RepID=UPI001957D6BD|nr:MBL fold metallo-hydrolase [Actibacterium sp. 188UL27-1]MBM7066565.1 MBL fold metallo-hydrolase [Actibacterium sp. 188UL27-1]
MFDTTVPLADLGQRARDLVVQPLAEGLWRVHLGFVNAYAIALEDGIALVDTGLVIHVPWILHNIRPLGPLRHIVLSHAHVDHAGGARQLSQSTGAEVWAGRADAAMLEQGRCLRGHEPSPSVKGYAFTYAFARVHGPRMRALPRVHPLDHGDALPFAPQVKVIGLPGHCLGQIGLRWTTPDGLRALFIGDALGRFLEFGHPILYEDRAAGIETIRQVAAYAAEADMVLPGHGRPDQNAAENIARFSDRLTA